MDNFGIADPSSATLEEQISGVDFEWLALMISADTVQILALTY